MNRAARRLRSRAAAQPCGMVLPVSVAIMLEAEMPVPGLRPLLLEVRRDHGPDVLVEICGECQTLGVVR